MNGLQKLGRARAVKLLGAVVLASSLLAIFAEFRKPPPGGAGYATSAGLEPLQVSGRALTYAELRDTSRGPGRDLYLANAELLVARLPALDASFERRPGQREQMLRNRARRRAYDGAPPTVPHPIDERALPNCLLCHERGAVVGELRAPAISHPPMGSCLQCHAPEPASHGSPVTTSTLQVVNAFEPEPPGGGGTRAWESAPPTRPHPWAMRENCGACHGVAGDPGLRTPHADRQNCEQCHVGDSASGLPAPVFAHGTGTP
jgi:cytochrome c-type protein NapB